MMKTNKSTSGRPKDTFADPHVVTVEDKEGNVIAKKCTYCEHRFSIRTSVTRIKAHLGGVPGQGVAPCKRVPSNVKEAAKNAMPSSSSNPRPDVSISCESDMRQPLPQERCTSYHPSPQTMPSVQEQCPSPVNASLLQSNVDSTCLVHLEEMETIVAEGPISQEDTLDYLPESMDDEQPWKDDEGYHGGVPDQNVASCEEVLSNVKEVARNVLPSSSSNPRSDAILLLSQPITNISSGSDLQQPLPQECCTSFPPPSQSMPSVHEQCPRLLDDSFHQSNDYSTCSGLTVIPEAHGSQDILDHRQDDVQLMSVSSHTTDIEQLCKDIKDNLGGVPDQNVAPCENDPSNVEEAAKNAWPSSSSNPVNIPSSAELQQPPLQDCYASGPPPPPQNMLPDGSSQQTYIELTYLEEQLNRPDVETPDGFESQENFCSYILSFSAGLGPAATQQHCMNDETNFLQETLTSHEIPSMGSDCLQLLQPISESLHVNPPPSSEPVSHDMDIVPSPVPSDTTPTASDQTKLGKKRKLPNKALPSGKKLPMVIKYRGRTFDRKVEEIYASLRDDSVNRIGVYGMGGSGKTTIMKCIHNQLLDDCFMPFNHVIWVTVSQDHTIPKLQRYLASKLSVTLAPDEDQVAWAATLYEKMQNICYALILDDVWNIINLEEIGIPEPSQENKCKLILTTRSLDVCHKMNCKPAIFVSLLSQEEAWDLFVETLNDTPKDSIIQGIMKEVVKECARLPLAIVTVAGSMKGIHNIHEWRNALDSLRSRTYGFTDMDEKVIEKLKFSYFRLSEQLQQCLLYCTLFPEDHAIRRLELIEMLISEGTVGSTESWLSAYDYGHTVINKLVNACLLIPNDSNWVIMHDLIRDMCLDIVGDRFLVKCGSKFPPDESKYTEDVERVSLMGSYFEEIPLRMVPHCPKLSTLLLSKNRQLTRIAESFFMDLPRLKVLNLSSSSIQELPNSVTNLVSLNALVLRHCQKLKRLPCLAPLKALKKLDLYDSGIEEAPKGLGELVNLTYLDLYGTAIRTLPSSILGKLVKLQHLRTGWTRIMRKDVKELKDLETFQARFAELEEYNGYVRSMLDSGRRPSKFDVTVCCGFMSYSSFSYERDGKVHAELRLKGDERTRGDNCLSHEVTEIIIPSPEIVDTLEVDQFGGNHFVISEVEREVSSSLHKLPIRLRLKEQTKENGELKCLFYDKLLLAFPNLRQLEVSFCNLIEELIPTSPSVGVFSSSLKDLIIYGCNKLMRLIDLKVLSYFQNLEEIKILHCKSLESIASIASPIEKEEESNNPISFPKLRRLRLVGLPNLRGICDSNDTLVCPSIESIEVVGCPKLKRLPLQVPMLDNNRRLEIEGEREWWESLELDHPNAKTLLQPYFCPFLWDMTTPPLPLVLNN